MNYKKPQITSQTKDAWRFFLNFVRPERTGILFTTLASASLTILIVPTLLLVKYAFDVLIPERDIKMLCVVGLVILILRMLNSFISVSIRRVHIRIINNIVFQIRAFFLKRFYQLSWLYYARADIKLIETRIVQDSERLTNMGTALLSRLLPSVIISIGLLVVLLFLNFWLLVLILCLFPLIFFVNRWISNKTRERVFQFQRSFELFSKGFSFVLKYMHLAVKQSAQQYETERQTAVLNDLHYKTGRMAIIYAINSQIQETLTGLSAIVIIIVGGISVANNSMSLGEFLSFYLAALYLNKYLNMITAAIPDIVAGNESLKTIFALSQEGELQAANGNKIAQLPAEISVRHVSFAYNNYPVLTDVNLSLKPGEIVAISGVNGSGKTTLLNLIIGNLKPDSGDIFINETSLSDLDLIDLHSRIGVVMQHPSLFSGTIKDNICYGNSIIDNEKLQLSVELAALKPFIELLPQKFETLIGEDGLTLSGGETQKIALARALYKNPSLLILDEPTNHLDANTINQVLLNIKEFDASRTILIVSHNKDVLKFADKVFHLKNGLLIEGSEI